MKKIKDFFTKYLWSFPVLLAVILRLYKITTSSIWHDEGYTMWLIRYGFLEIVERTARDVHPPAYYFFAKIWTLTFGNSVFSIRFLSLLFSVGIVYLTFKILKEIWSEKAAFWAAMFVAASPFMVRFGQEARMYGVVAFFTTSATFFFIKYIKENRPSYLLYYAPTMIIAMYTQYYSFFVIIAHWLILSIYTNGFWKVQLKDAWKARPGIFDSKWWVANAVMLAAYLPWFPVAYKQVTRVSGSYWIRPEWITERTIPGNVLQFVFYDHLDSLYRFTKFGPLFYWLIVAALLLLAIIFVIKKDWKKVTAIAIFGYLPMILVFVLSKLRTPVYQDRYFPFSAVALFALWGIAVAAIKNKKVEVAIALSFMTVLFYGNYLMHKDVNHKMKQATDVLKTQALPGDAVASGELYTFLDGTYYLGDKNITLLSPQVDGYGESSLFYDQPEEYVTEKAENLGNRVWVLGKSGKDYYKPERWQGWDGVTYYEDGGLRVSLYIKR